MKFPANTKEYQNYIVDALEKVYGKPVKQMGTGGSIGSLLSIQEVLGLTTYSLGFELPMKTGITSMNFSDYPGLQRSVGLL